MEKLRKRSGRMNSESATHADSLYFETRKDAAPSPRKGNIYSVPVCGEQAICHDGNKDDSVAEPVSARKYPAACSHFGSLPSFLPITSEIVFLIPDSAIFTISFLIFIGNLLLRTFSVVIDGAPARFLRASSASLT